MKRFCKNSKERATEKVNYEKKEMIPLTNKERKLRNKQKVSYICEKRI